MGERGNDLLSLLLPTCFTCTILCSPSQLSSDQSFICWIMRNSALMWMLFQSPQTEDMEEVLNLQSTLFIVTATDGYNLLFILFSQSPSMPRKTWLDISVVKRWQRKNRWQFSSLWENDCLQSRCKSIANHFRGHKQHLTSCPTRAVQPVSLYLV